MRLIQLFILAAAWWQVRRIRRATQDMRQANYYGIRALQTLVAVGSGPIPRTTSGVPAVPLMPVLRLAGMVRLSRAFTPSRRL